MPSSVLLSVFYSTSHSILTSTWCGGYRGFQVDTAVRKRRSRIWTQVSRLWICAQGAVLAAWLLISSTVWDKLAHLQEHVSWSVKKKQQKKYFFILDQLLKKTNLQKHIKRKIKTRYIFKMYANIWDYFNGTNTF